MHIFYFAFATQLALALAFWWKLPAFPRKGLDLSYPQVLWRCAGARSVILAAVTRSDTFTAPAGTHARSQILRTGLH